MATPNSRDHKSASDRPGEPGGDLTGAWWDATSRTATTVTAHADDITQQALSLVVEEVLRRIGPPEQAAELVADTLAARPGPPSDTAQAAVRSSDTADQTLPAHHQRRRATNLLDEAFALIVLTAPLVVAGWFQAHAVHALLDGLPWPLAIGFTTAWEGAAAYCARLYLRALLRGDSTIVLRAGMIGYAAVSAGLLWVELHLQGKPPWLAAAVGALTASGIFLWSRRARDLRRDDLHRMGRVDRQVVKFSLASWLLCPMETPAALRYAVKHRIEEPATAITRYRRHRMLRALRKARTAARMRQLAGGPRSNQPTPTYQRVIARRQGMGDRPPANVQRHNAHRRPIPLHRRRAAPRHHGVRQPDIDARTLAKLFPGRIPGRNEVVRRTGWGKPKAGNAIAALRSVRSPGRSVGA
jgi:hypothetical protein